MKELKRMTAACLSFLLAFALLPLTVAGSQAFADEPQPGQNGGGDGVILELDQVIPLSVNQVKITYSVINNTDETLSRSNVIGLYKRTVTKANFIVYRQLREAVQPGETVQMTDTVRVTGIGSAPLALRIFDNGRQYPKVTPTSFPVGDAAGHVVYQVVDTTQTVELSSFSVKRVSTAAVTVTYTVTNKTEYTVSRGSFISFYKDSPTKENFLLKRTLTKAVPAGTSVTMTDRLIRTGIASEHLVARLFDNNSGIFPYVYPSPFSDIVTENKTQYAVSFGTKIICVGDSITSGIILGGAAYPSRLQNELGDDYAVANYGVSGRTAGSNADLPYINTSAYKKAMDSNPNIVIIMLGSNDSRSRNWTEERKAEFKDSYAELIEGFIDLPSAPQVYLATPIQVTRANFYGLRENVLAEDIRPMIRELAAEFNLPLIENETLLTSGKGYYLLDGVHPSSKGHERITENIADSIRANT
jgi:lysophospholipase L1-like esterase